MTALMSNYKSLEIELTSHCNIRCPGCLRTLNGDTHPRLELKSIPYELFIERIPEYILKDKNISFCGAVGEPLMHKDFLKIAQYCLNAGASVQVDTNASLRSVAWWKELGSLSQKYNLEVRFSVDGHSETNRLYRVRADFNKILENMKAYTQAGGKGIWQYIIFRHNRHEVDKSREEAKNLGLKFITKVNTRIPNESWPTYNESYKELNIAKKVKNINYQYGNTTKPTFVHQDLIDNSRVAESVPVKNKTERKIKCWMIEKSGLFLAFDGKLWPCCYFNSAYHDYVMIDESTKSSKAVSTGKYLHGLDNYYGKHWNSIYKRSWEQIINHTFFKEYLIQSFENNPLYTCEYECLK